MGEALHRAPRRSGAARPRRRARRGSTARSRRRAACPGSGGCRRRSRARRARPRRSAPSAASTAGWYSSRWPTIRILPGALGGRARRARRRRRSSRAASPRSSACRPRATAHGELGVGGHGRGQHDRVELVVVQQVVELAGRARARGSARASFSRASLGGVAQPAQLAAGDRGEVAREVRAPVAEADDADAHRARSLTPRSREPSPRARRSPHAALGRVAVAVQLGPLGRAASRVERRQRGARRRGPRACSSRSAPSPPTRCSRAASRRAPRQGTPPSGRPRSRSAPRAPGRAAR